MTEINTPEDSLAPETNQGLVYYVHHHAYEAPGLGSQLQMPEFRELEVRTFEPQNVSLADNPYVKVTSCYRVVNIRPVEMIQFKGVSVNYLGIAEDGDRVFLETGDWEMPVGFCRVHVEGNQSSPFEFSSTDSAVEFFAYIGGKPVVMDGVPVLPSSEIHKNFDPEKFKQLTLVRGESN